MLSLSFANVVSYASQETQSARWVGLGERWQVSDNAGGYLKNTWFQDDVTGHWYMLGAEDGSVMYAGLITDQSTGKTYLLNTNHDGTYGRMLTENGAYTINGKVVSLSFDQSHDGTYGAITSGLSEARSTGVEEKELDSIPTDSNSSTGNSSGSSSVSNTSNTSDTSNTPTYLNKSLSEMTLEERRAYKKEVLGIDTCENVGSVAPEDRTTGLQS
jgi:hypothetical protein